MAEIAQMLGEVAESLRPSRKQPSGIGAVPRRLALIGALALAAITGGVFIYRQPAQPVVPVAKIVPFRSSIEAQKMLNGSTQGDPYVASSNEVFKAGWKFRIALKMITGGYFYLVNQGPDKSGGRRYYILYPLAAERQKVLKANEELRTGWYQFDENPGTERLWMIWSGKPLAALDDQLRGPSAGSVESAGVANAIEILLSTPASAEFHTQVTELVHR